VLLEPAIAQLRRRHRTEPMRTRNSAWRPL
jgi:hypothetical protein